jgi:hypothetical protein
MKPYSGGRLNATIFASMGGVPPEVRTVPRLIQNRFHGTADPVLEIRRNTWVEPMRKHPVLTSRFPEHEFAIRRLCSRNPEFITVCDDYEDASTALQHWVEAGVEYAERADEYRQLLHELEAEVLSNLETWREKSLQQDV